MIKRRWVIISFVIAVGLFAVGGYVEGGITFAFTRASAMAGIILLSYGVFLVLLITTHNLIRKIFYDIVGRYLITVSMIFRDPKIGEKTTQEIETSAKDLQKLIETIKKVLQ